MTEENSSGAVPPKVTPGAPRPITVRLKPVAMKTETQRAAAAEAKEQQAAEPIETVITATAGRTARVPIPTFDDLEGSGKPAGVTTSATVKLRPVRVPGAPLQPPFTSAGDAHKPGSNPLPPGPKPPSEAQVQAAKSKTSRISLEAAIGVAPDGPMSGGGPKTIRLKRPAKLDGTSAIPTTVPSRDDVTTTKSRTAPIGKTSRIPDGALPEQDDDTSATVTQKKTLKIKRKGSALATETDFPDGVELTPISDLSDFQESSGGGAFTVFAGIAAILAAIVMLLLTICLAAQAIGPAAGKNNLASIKLGMDLPWPGKIPR